MRRIFLIIFCAAVAGCSYTPEPANVAEGTDVGATGKIQYDHEALGNGKHLLSITAAPGVMETESSIAQRIHIFANKFAASTCNSGFDFVHDPNFDQSVAGGFMKRTKSYVFQCSN